MFLIGKFYENLYIDLSTRNIEAQNKRVFSKQEAKKNRKKINGAKVAFISKGLKKHNYPLHSIDLVLTEVTMKPKTGFINYKIHHSSKDKLARLA